MSSGVKTVVINTQERALSVDINRLQALSQASYMQILRDWLIGEGVITTGSPLRAEVLSGLYAKPVNASFQLQVASGAMLCVETPATPDDDPLHLAIQAVDFNDPSLVVTPNVSGFARVDLLECRRTEVVLETDSRDIFNDTTGLFTAATVTKVKGSAMEFRVRAGTPAGGVPGPDLGWLPLTAILVPNGALSLDTCTLWDLRPLVDDLDLNSVSATSTRLIDGKFGVAINPNVDGVAGALSGSTTWVFANRFVGGILQTTVPGTLKQYINAPAESSAGFAPADGAMVFGYLCFPGGYPRWSRYTDSGTRVPTNFRGIHALSALPCDVGYVPSASIALPASTGLGTATASQATCIYAGIWSTGQVAPRSFEFSNGTILFAEPTSSVGGPRITAAALGLSANFTLNVDYPAPVSGIGIHATKKISVGNVFFTANVGYLKRFDMDVGIEFAAPAYVASSSGNTAFGMLSDIGVRSPLVPWSSTIRVSGRAWQVPLLPQPAGVSRPTIAVFMASDNTGILEMNNGLVADYAATPVVPETTVYITNWKFA